MVYEVLKSDQKRVTKNDLIFGQLFHIHLCTFDHQNNVIFDPKIDQKWVIFDVIFDQKKALFYVILDTLFGPNRQLSGSDLSQKGCPKSDPKRSLFGHFWHFWDPQK